VGRGKGRLKIGLTLHTLGIPVWCRSLRVSFNRCRFDTYRAVLPLPEWIHGSDGRPGERRSRLRGRHAIVIVALALGLLWVYGPVAVGLVAQWRHDENYSHGFVVVPFAAFVAWTRRDALRRAALCPTLGGLTLLAISLLIFTVGKLGAELFLTRLSLIGVLAGSIAFIWGRAHLRILAFPLAFLVFMVPLPAIVFNQLTFPLQLFASTIGESVIRGLGIPVLREGNVLQLPSRTLEVAEACSGIRSLTSLLMLGIVLGYFTEQRTATRVLIALATIPLAVVANAMRVAGTGITSEWISPTAADGFLHTFSGMVMFVIALLGLGAVQQVVSRIPVRVSRRTAVVERR
jgi:exosortase